MSALHVVARPVAIVLGVWLCALSAGAGPDATWTLTVEAVPPEGEDVLGLAGRNEANAGERGRISVDDHGDFVRGDGAPIRFWCATSYVAERMGDPELRQHARELALRGVNLVRIHGHLNPGPAGPIERVNSGQISALQRAVAAFKAEGIYTIFSPYWAHAEAGPAWKLRGFGQGQLWGLLFFDPQLQRAYKGWLREALTRPNPYADGLPLARDPALAILQIQNEDSLLFWTAQRLPPEKLELLNAGYQRWRLARGLRSNVPLEIRFDDLSHVSRTRMEGIRFLAETMRGWNREVTEFLRKEVGYGGLINAGNWKTADQTRMLDLERWTYAGNDVIAANRYTHGRSHQNPTHPRFAGYRIEPGDVFEDTSALLDPTSLVTNLRQIAGRAFIISEGGWVAPASYRSDGPLVVAAYSSLHGLDGFCWFRLHQIGFDAKLDKWGTASPDVMGGWPAASLLYRRGDARLAEPAVRVRRTDAELFELNPLGPSEPSSGDPNRDSADQSGREELANERLRFLTGPITVEFGAHVAEAVASDSAGFIDRRGRHVRSRTKEIDLDWGNGVLVVDTPRAQGAAGFLSRRSPIELRDVRIQTKTDYLSVVAISLDDLPLANSTRVLLQITTTARPSGWRVDSLTLGRSGDPVPPRYRILDVGKPPWVMYGSSVSVWLRNPNLGIATVVDPFLRRTTRSSAIQSSESGVVVTPPSDAMYVLVERSHRPNGAPEPSLK